MAARRICSIEGCGKPHYTHGFCRTHSYRWLKHGDPLGGRFKAPVAERFWRFVPKAEEYSCWVWSGMTDLGGYGQIVDGGRGGKWLKAHRLSWEIHHGSIPHGMNVLHRCDNPPCVNPAHLFLGTQLDNVSDCIAKGRFNIGHGGNHHKAKITERDVVEIFRLRSEGATMPEIAEKFGVTRATIWGALQRRTWKHVELTVPAQLQASRT